MGVEDRLSVNRVTFWSEPIVHQPNRPSRICAIYVYVVIISSSLVQFVSSIEALNHHERTGIELWKKTGADITSSRSNDGTSDRLVIGQPRRRQSSSTLLSHKQNLITGSANTPLTSPYNQFYLTNSVNSPHNGKQSG